MNCLTGIEQLVYVLGWITGVILMVVMGFTFLTGLLDLFRTRTKNYSDAPKFIDPLTGKLEVRRDNQRRVEP